MDCVLQAQHKMSRSDKQSGKSLAKVSKKKGITSAEVMPFFLLARTR
jgi:hypothetical protein